jgi:hypothetical protein
MAALGLGFSQRLYPIPFQWGRLAAVAAGAAAVTAAARLAPGALVPALAVKTALLAVFAAILTASGLWHRPKAI